MRSALTRYQISRSWVFAVVGALLIGAALNGSAAVGHSAVVSAARKSDSGQFADVQPTERLAQIAAEADGGAVEVAGLRQERRTVYANADGSFTAYQYTEPVRTVRNGSWVPVDTSLARRTDGGWSPKAATVDLEFSDGGDEPFARMRKAGREYSLSWPGGTLPAPTVTGSTATYAEVLPGVDLVVRAESDGLSHLLVVKSADAAANPALKTIEFGLSTKGLTVEETSEGTLRAVDSAVGGTVFESGTPVMWDSSDGAQAGGAGTAVGEAAVYRPAGLDKDSIDAAFVQSSATGSATTTGPKGGNQTAPVDISLESGQLLIAPDQDLLNGPDTVYPVVIDPTNKTTSRSAWTSVMSASPSDQDWKYSGGAGVGKCPANYNPDTCADVGVRRLLFTMPTSFYSGKHILKATFSARISFVYWADAKAEPIDLYRIGGKNHAITSASDWSNSQDDWDDYLMTVDKAINPTSCSSQANLHFEGGELTQDMQTAADDDWSAMSLGLRAKDESTYGGWKRVCGNAYLSISYDTPPKQVDYHDMSTNPGGRCTWGTDRPYTNVMPQLRTEARDPDHTSSRTDQVKVQFKVDWTAKDGTAQSYTADTSYKAPNVGTTFAHTVKSSVAENLQPGSVVYWSARAYDGDAWGPWSYDGDPQRCEFIYDPVIPGAPAVTSDQYPDDEVWHHGVGTPGTFTFAPNPDDDIVDNDVIDYHYSFDGETSKTVSATTAGGSASVTWTPMNAGRHWVTVTAEDPAGNASVEANYEFLATEGRPVSAQWKLADEAGADVAHDESLDYPAEPGSGVTFGVTGPGGAADSAVRLDGSDGAYLDARATVLDTRENFSVSAWARPTNLDRDMAVVSQDGSGEPGFTLGYNSSAGAWTFSMPVSDVTTLGSWKAVSPASVVKDQWVLLTGVYDAHAAAGPTMTLYVNDQPLATTTRDSEWTSHGSLQIGRAMAKSGYKDHFSGDLAEVRLFDRVVPQQQVDELMTVKPQRKGYWPVDSATGGSSANVESGGMPLTLNGDASIYQPADPVFDPPALVGDGNLVLDGDGDWASTSTPPVTGGTSFTIAARAELTSLDPVKSQTVLSLAGTSADRIDVRYQASTGQWELAVAQSDAADAAVTVVTDDQELPVAGGVGQHLAVVYDAFANDIRLFVNGQLASTAEAKDNTLWKATGGLQVGRSAQYGGSEYFAGAIDEVRVYAGAVDPTGVGRMRQLTPDPDL